MEEVDTDLLVGPCSDEKLTNVFGCRWTGARRFGIQQGDKIRSIDDFSEFQVNSGFGASNKINLLSIEEVVSRARAWSEAVSDEHLTISDSQERCWSTTLHDEWRDGKLADLVGRVGDLRSAYKQLPLSADSRRFCVISSPATGKAELFIPSALRFGQTAAVYAFLRFSRAISRLLSELLSLTTVEFLDDFTQLEPTASAQSAQDSFEGLLRLLGWEIATEEKKRKPFAKKFISLGALVDLIR